MAANCAFFSSSLPDNFVCAVNTKVRPNSIQGRGQSWAFQYHRVVEEGLLSASKVSFVKALVEGSYAVPGEMNAAVALSASTV